MRSYEGAQDHREHRHRSDYRPATALIAGLRHPSGRTLVVRLQDKNEFGGGAWQFSIPAAGSEWPLEYRSAHSKKRPGKSLPAHNSGRCSKPVETTGSIRRI